MSPLESIESSSPLVTRAVAAGLSHESTHNYKLPTWQKVILLLLGRLPQAVARVVISQFQKFSGLPPSVFTPDALERLINQRLNDYAHLRKKFPVITVGAALGGATTYLSLSLNAPFLPQTFVTSLKGGSPDGNVERYLHRSFDLALRIAKENPGWMTIQHYDPVHDGWLTRWVNHLRFKLLTLPCEYKRFIRERLQPGGTIIFLDCGARWPRYRLGPRSIFQIGGWGDIPPEDFLHGSPRLSAYARSARLKAGSWGLPQEFLLENGPESEWGSEPSLVTDLEHFCRDEGLHFQRIFFPHPNDFSRLAFYAAQRLISKQGGQPAGVLVETFSQFDVYASRQASLLPLWLIFNTWDSARYLREMTSLFPSGKPIFFSPLATFSLTPDMVPWEGWQEALGKNFINIGARQDHYPSDARAIVKWNFPLRQWVQENSCPITTFLEPGELVDLASTLPHKSD